MSHDITTCVSSFHIHVDAQTATWKSRGLPLENNARLEAIRESMGGAPTPKGESCHDPSTWFSGPWLDTGTLWNL